MLVDATHNPLDLDRHNCQWKGYTYPSHIITVELKRDVGRQVDSTLDYLLDYLVAGHFEYLADIPYAEHTIIKGDLC